MSPCTGSGVQSDSRGGPRHRCCKPVWLPCRACGMEQGGGEKRGRAWAAGGRGLQPPEPRQPRRSLLSLPLAPTRARTAPGPAPHPGGAAAPRPTGATRRSYAERGSSSEWPGLWRPLAAQFGRRTGGEGRGKRGHTLAAARAHCTLAAARPRRGASGARVAPLLRPRHLPALSYTAGPAPGPQTLATLVCTAVPSPGGSNHIPVTCRLWRNWSRKRRRPNAARVR